MSATSHRPRSAKALLSPCSILNGPVMGAGLGLKTGWGGRTPKVLVAWRAWNYRPKGHAALSRSTSVKPPALPEVADCWPGLDTSLGTFAQKWAGSSGHQAVEHYLREERSQ